MSKGKELEGELEREDVCSNDNKHGSKERFIASDLCTSICIYSHIYD